MVFIMLFSIFGIYGINLDIVNAQSGMATVKRVRKIKYPSAFGDYST